MNKRSDINKLKTPIVVKFFPRGEKRKCSAWFSRFLYKKLVFEQLLFCNWCIYSKISNSDYSRLSWCCFPNSVRQFVGTLSCFD